MINKYEQNTTSDAIIVEEIELPADVEIADLPIGTILEEDLTMEEIPIAETEITMESAPISDADLEGRPLYNLDPDTFLKDLEGLY